MWSAVCRGHKVSKSRLALRDVYTALRLLDWVSIRQDRQKASWDPEERILWHAWHDPHRYAIEFRTLFYHRPISAADALCLLKQNVPQLEKYLGLSNEQLRKRLKTASAQKLVHQVVPDDWKTKSDMNQHFVVLIRSIEVWCEVWHKVHGK